MDFSSKNTIKSLTLLELPDDKPVTEDIVHAQYRKLCKIYHPDQADDRYKDGHKFRQIKDAHDYLLDNLAYVNKQIASDFGAKPFTSSYNSTTAAKTAYSSSASSYENTNSSGKQSANYSSNKTYYSNNSSSTSNASEQKTKTTEQKSEAKEASAESSPTDYKWLLKESAKAFLIALILALFPYPCYYIADTYCSSGFLIVLGIILVITAVWTGMSCIFNLYVAIRYFIDFFQRTISDRIYRKKYKMDK